MTVFGDARRVPTDIGGGQSLIFSGRSDAGGPRQAWPLRPLFVLDFARQRAQVNIGSVCRGTPMEESMPLTRSNEKILTTMMGVKFLMRDGKTEVACRAARELLRYRFGSSDRGGDGETFKLHREAIDKAATHQYHAAILEHNTA